MARSRAVLDALPGRAELSQRLAAMLAIGSVSAPQMRGARYFFTRRSGDQNQPVLFLRQGLRGEPRALLDPNTVRAYSPYHQVRAGVRYPAILLTTAEGDSRVDPMHARKMAALLQYATAADAQAPPVLLRVEGRAGHGAGKPIAKVLEEAADIWAFLRRQLR